jgi:cytochrome aa3-600 menaquinol oxidase subunit 4
VSSQARRPAPVPEPTEQPAREAGEALGFLMPHFAADGPPWPQVTAYVVSLLLTFAAVFLTVNRLLSPRLLLALILALAAGQGGLQLGVFMHLRESRGPAWHVLALGLALATGIGLVGMSIWIMAFKSGVS